MITAVIVVPTDTRVKTEILVFGKLKGVLGFVVIMVGVDSRKTARTCNLR